MDPDVPRLSCGEFVRIVENDIWWIVTQLNTSLGWANTQKKLSMYKAAFVPFRGPDYFQDKASVSKLVATLEADLPRLLPGSILTEYRKNNFQPFVQTLKQVTAKLLDQGIRIEFSKISAKLFFGYETHPGFYMATPEKAVPDTLYYRGGLPVVDELELQDVNQEAVMEMAKKFPSPVMRKMTQILETVHGKAV